MKLAVLLLTLSCAASAFAQPAARTQIGVCLDPERFEAAKAAGFDYVEISASKVAGLSDEEFERLVVRTQELGIPVAAANGFLPAAIRLVGPDVDKTRQESYVSAALARLKRLGVATVVLGSGGARRVPDGFSREEATRQFVDFCRRIAPIARAAGITIAIEPLRRQETNIINTAKEGLTVVKAVDRPEIRLLVDYYHLSAEGESPAVILEAGKQVVHVHVANPVGRVYPLGPDESAYAAFFTGLCRVGYSGRVSVEASTPDFAAQAPRALATLRGLTACATR